LLVIFSLWRNISEANCDERPYVCFWQNGIAEVGSQNVIGDSWKKEGIAAAPVQ